MANIKDKLKLKKGMKEKIKNEASGNKNDPRFLNYYDLKDGDKMHILFVPDVNGDIWTKFKLHGPNLDVKGVGAVRCSDEAHQNDCPACQQGYELLNEGKEDDNDYETYKEEAKRWFGRESFIAQCLVLESPFEVNESPDGNQVKLIRLPFAVKSIIEESVIEGLVEEDEICTTPFVLKNKKTGKNNGYKTSYFARQEVTDDELEFFEDLMVEPYDFTDLDVIPKPTTEADVQKWLDTAIKKVYSDDGGEDDDDDDDDDDDKEDDRKKSKRESKKSQRSKKQDDDDDQNEDDSDDADQKDDSDNDAGSKKKSSLRDRLKNMDR